VLGKRALVGLEKGIDKPKSSVMILTRSRNRMAETSADPSQPSRSWLTSPVGLGGAWPQAQGDDCLFLHLNLSGEGSLALPGGRSLLVRPQSLIWARGVLGAARLRSKSPHECLTLSYPNEWLENHLKDLNGQLVGRARQLVNPPFVPLVVVGRSLARADLTWARGLMAPHLCDAARRLMEIARMTDYLIGELFVSQTDDAVDSVVSRAERAAQERIEKVKAYVMADLETEHTLESLARTAGCSPHYLSRTFSKVAGLSLMLWIRRARIDRAGELLASGRCNVSEAALEVGYRSFSHFSRAFSEEKGVSPSRWVEHLSATKR
jgi:AraC-like DNA-binding protein